MQIVYKGNPQSGRGGSVRSIQYKLIEFLDEKLIGNGLAMHAIETKDARLLFVEAAKVCVGVRERTGNNDGPMVELFQSTIGTASGESWCMSFVQSMLNYCEFKTGKKSPIFASEHCLTVWQSTSKDQRVRFNPLPGAVVIWRHGSSSSGHTGIVLGADEKIFQAVEGNTESGKNPNGAVVREGGGVYYTVRSRDGNGDMHVMGYLKPF